MAIWQFFQTQFGENRRSVWSVLTLKSSAPTFRRRECWPGFSARDIETLVTLVTTFAGLSSFFSWNFGGQLFGGLGEDCWDCWVSASDEVWCLSKWTSLNKTKWTCSTWWLWLCDSASRSEHGEIHTEYNSDEESCHRKIPGGIFHGYFETFSDVTSTCAMGPRGHGGHVWPGVTWCDLWEVKKLREFCFRPGR